MNKTPSSLYRIRSLTDTELKATAPCLCADKAYLRMTQTKHGSWRIWCTNCNTTSEPMLTRSAAIQSWNGDFN